MVVDSGYVDNLIERHFSMCEVVVDAILGMERTPFAQNTHYLKSSSDKWLSRYRDARAKRSPKTIAL